MRTRHYTGIAILMAGLLLAAGCASQPDRPEGTEVIDDEAPSPVPSVPPEPTGTVLPRLPELEDLVITPAGLGSLRVGGLISETDMVVLTPDVCYAEGNGDVLGDPKNARWLAAYPPSGTGEQLFSADVRSSNEVRFINVKSQDLSTTEGVHVGSTIDELRAAYPALQTRDPLDNPLSTLYWVTTEEGTLSFEAPTPDYWPEFGNKVVVIGIHGPYSDEIGQIVGGDGGAGSCF